MSDSCSAAHHKSCFTVPCSGIPLLFPLLCVATSACKAHSSSPLSVRPWVLLLQWLVLGRWAEKWQETANAKAVIVCSCDLNPLLAIHHFLQYGLHNLHPLGTEMCWGKQRVPKVTTGTLSAPALPFTPILADRANEEEIKSYFAWVLVMQWLFEHKDFSSGLVFRYRRQEQMKETHQADFVHSPCLPVWLLSQRTQVCLGHAWKQTPESSCQPETRKVSQICNIKVGMAVIRRVGTILFLCSS